MKEIAYDGNLFLLPSGDREAGVVTTNGVITRSGNLVMGAGIAKYCRDNHKGIDGLLGELVAQNGNVAHDAGRYRDADREKNGLDPYVTVLSMPTKNDWRNQSDINLIQSSCRGLSRIADAEGLERVYLPMPGCANGGLDYLSQVRPILEKELDGRFTVCVPSHIWRMIWKDKEMATKRTEVSIPVEIQEGDPDPAMTAARKIKEMTISELAKKISFGAERQHADSRSAVAERDKAVLDAAFRKEGRHE